MQCESRGEYVAQELLEGLPSYRRREVHGVREENGPHLYTVGTAIIENSMDLICGC